MKILVMPAGEAGADQSPILDALKRLHEAGAEFGAVQAVMDDAKSAGHFIRDLPDWFAPPWRWMWRPSTLVRWYVKRRIGQIGEVIGNPDYRPELVVTDYERMRLETAPDYIRAVATVSRILDTDGLFGSGDLRFPYTLQSLVDATKPRALFPPSYFRVNYGRGIKALPIASTVLWARDQNLEVKPYVSAIYQGEHGGGLVMLPHLVKMFQEMHDLGVTEVVNWIDLLRPNAVESVARILQAAGSVR